MSEKLLEPVETLATPIIDLQPLRTALRSLEIEPFDSMRVEVYKLNLLDQSWAECLAILKQRGWSDKMHESDQQMYGGSGYILTYFGSRWRSKDRYCYMRDMHSSYPRCFAMGWHRMSVTDTKDIPQFVSHKMEQITQEVPGATFEVDKLESDSREYDPFLVVRFGNEQYYIEVWGDEDDEDHKFPR